MRRVFIIARSEFHTAVRARGFLIGIMLMPLLFGGAMLLQRVVERQANSTVRRVAIIDDTGRLFAPLSAAAAAWNRGERDLGPDVPDGPRFAVERMRPAPADRPHGSPCRNGCGTRSSSPSSSCPPACWDRKPRRRSATTRARPRTASCPTGCSAPS